jgi:serine/threonine protein phosphatase PrpC
VEVIERGVAERPEHFVDEDMTKGALVEMRAGLVAVFSARSPFKPPPNEDAAAIFPYGESDLVLAVADGVGGARAGHEASKIAIETLETTLARGAEKGSNVRNAILNGFEEANRAVMNLGIGAATTLAAVEIRERVVRPYHAGDSLMLVVGQRGKLKMQSVPHSPVGYGVEAGLLDEAEAMVHEERHVVSNVIGSPDMKIEIGPSLRLAARDTLLIASDGLWDNLHKEEIIEAVRRGPIAMVVRTLRERCSEQMRRGEDGSPSKPDDLTFIVFRTKIG